MVNFILFYVLKGVSAASTMGRNQKRVLTARQILSEACSVNKTAVVFAAPAPHNNENQGE